MDFEIIGELRNIELIAIGRGIHDLARLRQHLAQCIPQSFTGMKPTVSDGKNSNSNFLSSISYEKESETGNSFCSLY